ncbi:MAG: hypothetical protein M1820_002600 [Bogoriella megaspora]|nr:MAG: hypothetical protein M1820_002600 [Bogoriella megaspora]
MFILATIALAFFAAVAASLPTESNIASNFAGFIVTNFKSHRPTMTGSDTNRIFNFHVADTLNSQSAGETDCSITFPMSADGNDQFSLCDSEAWSFTLQEYTNITLFKLHLTHGWQDSSTNPWTAHQNLGTGLVAWQNTTCEDVPATPSKGANCTQSAADSEWNISVGTGVAGKKKAKG